MNSATGAARVNHAGKPFAEDVVLHLKRVLDKLMSDRIAE